MLQSICSKTLTTACVPRIRFRAHPLALESWRLVRTARDYVMHVAYLRYFFSIGKAVPSNVLNVILPCRKTKREIILRHYIHLGLPERFESCSACSVLTVILHAVASCPDCLEVLERFVAYLRRAGEQPWNDSESTIIGISSARL